MKLSIQRPHYAVQSVDWILETILSDWLGINLECIDGDRNEIRLGLAANFRSSRSTFYVTGHTLTLPNTFFSRVAEAWLSPSVLPELPLAQWDVAASGIDAKLVENNIPVLFGQPGFHMDESGNGHLNIDVFGSAFFMLSRYEEAVLSDRDSHDRFPSTASIAHKAGFLDRPIIDEYVQILWAAMKRVWPGLERKPREPQTVVSHDVDAPSLYAFRSPTQVMRGAAGDLLKRGDIAGAIRGPWVWLKSRQAIHLADPYNSFEWLMDVSERYGLISAFYFICGRTHPSLDAQYEIEHPAMRHLLRRIHRRGHEVGLHPSYNTYQNPQAIIAEADRLKRVCAQEGIAQTGWGGRMHFLRWEMPTTLHGWEQAGMTYDSTLSYADRVGFRCGTCYEYAAFDPVKRQALKLRIRPLIAMECTVMAERYMGLGASPAAYDEFMKLKKACQIVGGTFTLLWHNSQFTTHQERDLYEAVVAG